MVSKFQLTMYFCMNWVWISGQCSRQLLMLFGFLTQKILEPLLMSTKTILVPEIGQFWPTPKGVNYRNLTEIPNGPITF